MGLESPVTHVSDLVATNPTGGDPKSQGDDHIRNVKTALTTTFPNATKPFRFPNTKASQTGSFSVATTDQNALYPIDASSGASITVSLPAGSSLADGFAVELVRTDSDVVGGSVTVNANGSDTINGRTNTAPFKLYDQYQALRLIWFETVSAWYAPVLDGVLIGTPQLWLLDTVPNDAWLMLTGTNAQTSFTATDYPALADLWGGATPLFGGTAANPGLPTTFTGRTLRFFDPTASVDPGGATRSLADAQDWMIADHEHHINNANSQTGTAAPGSSEAGLKIVANAIDSGIATSADSTPGTLAAANIGTETRGANASINLMVKAR